MLFTHSRYCLSQIIYSNRDCSDENIADVFKSYPSTKFLTVTNYSSNRINKIITEHLFSKEKVLVSYVIVLYSLIEKLFRQVVDM